MVNKIDLNMSEILDFTKSRLINSDCIEALKSMPDSSVDCIITDPPYNLGLFMHQRGTNLKKMRDNQFAFAGWDNMEFEQWEKNMEVFFAQCSRVLKTRGTMIVFMAIIKVEDIIRLATQHKFYYKTTGIWHKTNPMPRNMKIQFVNSTECWIYFVKNAGTGTFNNGGKARHDFIESSVCPMSEKRHGNHPTQKPLSIMKQLIEIVTNPDDIVLDPFMGSGSTCVAAALTGRRYIGIELSEEYYNIASARISNLSELK